MHRLFFVAAAAAAAPPQWWSHDWSTAQAMQFIDFGYQLMNDEQAAFVASHYRVVSIEKCTGFWDWPSRSTEQAFLESAARLKRHNPSVRTLLYWDTDQASLQCYAGAAKLLAQPGWWLRGVDGAVLYADTARAIPYLNTSVPEGRAWWIGVPLGVAAAANIMDGVLVDGTGSRCPGGLAADACTAYVDGKFAMVAALRAALANGAVVLGNGLSLYSPAHNNDLDTLAGMDGIMLEHFAVFEQIRPDGAINVPLAAQALARVAEAAATGAAVVMACWPGPYTDAFDVHGFPGWAGAQAAPTTNEGWRAALLRYAPFALAAFLTVAETNVFRRGTTVSAKARSRATRRTRRAPRRSARRGIPSGRSRSGRRWAPRCGWATCGRATSRSPRACWTWTRRWRAAASPPSKRRRQFTKTPPDKRRRQEPPP